VRAVRDFAQVNDESAIGLPRVNHTLHALGIDDNGLDGNDRTILSTLIERFGGGPVGLSTLAAATAEEEETLEDVYEPYLMQCGYLQRTPKGRMATKHAYDLLGIPQPKNAATLF
jgi:Holliday junction DNA helicase RuvB